MGTDHVHDPEEELLGDTDEGCGPPTERDAVDDALEGLISALTDAGYDDKDAEDAVFSAMELLHGADQCTDTPDIDEPEEVKTAWIFNNVPRIRQKLREMGLEFAEG